MELKTIAIRPVGNTVVIIGQTGYCETAERIVASVRGCADSYWSDARRRAVALMDPSGPCDIRVSGDDNELERFVVESARSIGSDHTFVLSFTRSRDHTDWDREVLDRVK